MILKFIPQLPSSFARIYTLLSLLLALHPASLSPSAPLPCPRLRLRHYPPSLLCPYQVVEMRSRLNKKLSEANTYNRYLLREVKGGRRGGSRGDGGDAQRLNPRIMTIS